MERAGFSPPPPHKKAMTTGVKVECPQNGFAAPQAWPICRHAFSDLSRVPPLMFLYLLKESYACGKMKATAKFRVLQEQVHQVLSNSPQPGPASFAAHCLYVLPVLDFYYEGFSHLIISALKRFLKTNTDPKDILKAKYVAAKLFLYSVQGDLIHDDKILIKILNVFDVNLTDMDKIMQKNLNSGRAKKLVEKYVFELVESQSFMTAVALLEHFSIRQSGESFLIQMLQSKQYQAAEKWAAFMGKPMLCVLVKECTEMNLQKTACDIVKKNDLRDEFPELYDQWKESLLKKLAEKGLWDLAEMKAKGNRQRLEYVVYLALEAGYLEKVEELCTRYSLEGFNNITDTEAHPLLSSYLRLDELCVDDVVWVDNSNALSAATTEIEECKVLGLDCEWKPNYLKGITNKVSIMQIASETKVFIFDLIKLYDSVPDLLDTCLTRVLRSPRILKLGYNFKCDVHELSHSYKDLECFKHYEMLLDIQMVFKEHQGGLSGLAQKVLGRGLNKTRRNSNWEQRPLSLYQLEYAALDAVVLIHIFRHVRGHVQSLSVVPNDHSQIEWKSHIISHMDKPCESRKAAKSKGKNVVAEVEKSLENKEEEIVKNDL